MGVKYFDFDMVVTVTKVYIKLLDTSQGTKKVMSTAWIVFILLFLDLIGTTLDPILTNSCLHLFKFCNIFFLTFFTPSFTPPHNSNVLNM